MKRRQPIMYDEKKIIYQKPTTIKFWNLYDDNIFTYFMKRFSSYLSEIGLSCNQMGSPREHFEVKNPQSTKTNEFLILGMENWFYPKNPNPKIHEHYLNFDLNHLLFFNITDKEKEFNVLSEFNEILKPKNKSNEILNIDKSNPEFFLNPTFYLILYDSTNESGNFHPPKNSSIIISSYSDLNIIQQKHFDIQDFYEWLYKTTDRESRVIKRDLNLEYLKLQKKQMEDSPAYEMSITLAKIVRYECDCSQNLNDKSRLSEILNYYSIGELKKMGNQLKLKKIPIGKNQLINALIELSDQIHIRDSIIGMCKGYLKDHKFKFRSSKKSMAQIEKNAKKFSEILKPL